jgi:hypothetical protein
LFLTISIIQSDKISEKAQKCVQAAQNTSAGHKLRTPALMDPLPKMILRTSLSSKLISV